MNPDFFDPKLCICGESIKVEDEFCSKECEQDFYEVQAMAHYERQMETQHTVFLNMATGAWVSSEG
jgi:hypothetical protein